MLASQIKIHVVARDRVLWSFEPHVDSEQSAYSLGRTGIDRGGSISFIYWEQREELSVEALGDVLSFSGGLSP